MPTLSKKIINYIKNTVNFTKSELYDILVQPKIEKQKKKKSKKKNRPQRTQKDVSAIEDILQALEYGGFLKKNRNRYKRIHSFTLEGKISISSGRNGKVKTTHEDEIVIEKQNTGGAHNNDYVQVKIIDFRKGFFWGEVVKVIRRDKKYFLAKTEKKKNGAIYYSLLDIPGNVEVCSERFYNEPELNEIILLKLGIGFISNRPRCSIVKKYSPDNDSLDLTRIIIKHSLPETHSDYVELKNIQNRIRKTELQNRKDYTGLFTITIDGEDAKDFDDAISIERNSDGFKLFVHIADVSAFVLKETELDREALARGTSYYLGDHVIPMLPEKLSNDLCSLKQGLDRLTLSVEIDFNEDGNIRKHSFSRGLINVNRRLTYTKADKILDRGGKNRLYDTLKLMYDLSSILNRKRLAQGSLELNLNDVELIYEDGSIKEIRFAERLKSHNLIEEFMLSANIVVSKALREKGIPSLYRVHEAISPDSLKQLRNFLRYLNIRLKISGNIGTNIQVVLHEASGKDYEHVVNLVVLKSLMQANYGVNPEGHFGLGFKDYTHFTSPIRRYPDLVIHRCLKSLIDRSKHPYAVNELIYIGDKTSELERVAKRAERDLISIKSCRLMKDRVGEEFKGIVSGVLKFGFFVTLIDIPIEGMVPLKNLTDDYYLVREDEYTVTGKKFGRRFRIGDRIDVKLSNVDIERMIIDFDVV